MQSTFEQLEGLERKFTIEVPVAEVEQAVEETMRKARPNLRVAGFRPGKVPPHILQQKFGADLRRQALEKLIDENYRQALTAHKQVPVSAAHFDRYQGGRSAEIHRHL